MSDSTPGPKPLTRQRSRWIEHDTIILDGRQTAVWRRNVHDGTLTLMAALEPQGWHLSISHRPTGRSKRYPSWDEIIDARYDFVPDEVTMALILPPREQYIAIHDTVFHLHQIPGEVTTS